jgi:hypothetical protein
MARHKKNNAINNTYVKLGSSQRQIIIDHFSPIFSLHPKTACLYTILPLFVMWLAFVICCIFQLYGLYEQGAIAT